MEEPPELPSFPKPTYKNETFDEFLKRIIMKYKDRFFTILDTKRDTTLTPYILGKKIEGLLNILFNNFLREIYKHPFLYLEGYPIPEINLLNYEKLKKEKCNLRCPNLKYTPDPCVCTHKTRDFSYCDEHVYPRCINCKRMKNMTWWEKKFMYILTNGKPVEFTDQIFRNMYNHITCPHHFVNKFARLESLFQLNRVTGSLRLYDHVDTGPVFFDKRCRICNSTM